jgi:serine/threonine-protein kinase SRPK3
MASILKWARRSIPRAPSLPLRFPTSGFEIINLSEVVEEERFEDFKTGRYCPVNIGEVFKSKYQVIGKLGFGVTSTVWLARDFE